MRTTTFTLFDYLPDPLREIPRKRAAEAAGLALLAAVAAASLALLGSIAGAKVVPFGEAEQCCGFGGTFAVKYGEISDAIVTKKTENIAASQAPVLLAGDLGVTVNARVEGIELDEGD